MLSETEIFATKPFVCYTNLNLVTLLSYYELVGSMAVLGFQTRQL
jgi:hypothetical protein